MYKKMNKARQFLPNSSGLTIFAIIDLAVMKIVPPIMSTNGPEINIYFTHFLYQINTMAL